MPGTLIPPVAFSRCASAAARAFSTAALTAAVTRSSSIARSPPSIPSSAFGSIESFVTSHLPFIVTLTRPPPLSASTESSPSFSRASAIAFSSLRAWRIRYWMSIPSPLDRSELFGLAHFAVEDAGGFPDVRVVRRDLAHSLGALAALRGIGRRERRRRDHLRGRSLAQRDREPRLAPEVAREDALDLHAPALGARGVEPGRQLQPDLTVADPEERRLAQRRRGGRAHLLDLLHGGAPALGERRGRVVRGRAARRSGRRAGHRGRYGGRGGRGRADRWRRRRSGGLRCGLSRRGPPARAAARDRRQAAAGERL